MQHKYAKTVLPLSAMISLVLLALTACTGNGTPAPTATPIKHGWSTVLHEDFDKPAPLGQVGAVYGDNWRGYSGHGDTTGKAMYVPDAVLSVVDGKLDWYVHTEQGQPITAAPLPQGYTGQRYGRWTMRFRSDKINGYKIAALLWPDSDRWQDGEIDFPEGELGEAITGHAHDVTGNPAHNVFSFYPSMNMQRWHTVSIELLPGHLTFTIDGQSKTTRNPAALPTISMHPVLQVESSLDGPAPTATAAGHVQVDWVKIDVYNP